MFSAKLNSLEIRQKSFLNDSKNLISLGSSLLINIIHWAIVYVKLGRSTGTILLHYNVVYGPDFVDKAKFIYFIPLTALVLFIINIFVSRFMYRKEKLASYFLNFSNIVIQLIFITASIALILVNE